MFHFNKFVLRAIREKEQQKQLQQRQQVKIKQPIPINEKPIDPAIQAELNAQQERNNVRF